MLEAVGEIGLLAILEQSVSETGIGVTRRDIIKN